MKSLLSAAVVAMLAAACGSSAPLADLASQPAEVRGQPGSVGRLTYSSFVHELLTPTRPMLTFTLAGHKGDRISVDAWGTRGAKSPVAHPQLVLVEARGSNVISVAVEREPGHAVLETTLPSSAGYLVTLSAEVGSPSEATLRVFGPGQLPRPAESALDITSAPSDAMKAILGRHFGQNYVPGIVWSEADLAEAITQLESDAPGRTQLSDAQLMLMAARTASLDSPPQLTAAQAAKFSAAVESLVASPEEFKDRFEPEDRAFGLRALALAGFFDEAKVVSDRDRTGHLIFDRVEGVLASLLRPWAGAKVADAPAITVYTHKGDRYGFRADFEADQRELDASPVFTWFASEMFDYDSQWLGDVSEGAMPSDNGGDD